MARGVQTLAGRRDPLRVRLELLVGEQNLGDHVARELGPWPLCPIGDCHIIIRNGVTGT